MNQLEILAEAIRGWRDPSESARKRRESARRRAWAIRNGKPWRIDEIAAEIQHLWGTDTATNIARRLNYGPPESLIRRLYNNGYGQLAAKMERALRAERATRN